MPDFEYQVSHKNVLSVSHVHSYLKSVLYCQQKVTTTSSSLFTHLMMRTSLLYMNLHGCHAIKEEDTTKSKSLSIIGF